MSVTRARPPARRRRGRWFVIALVVVLAFALGVALGQALHDNPRPGGTHTALLTFTP